MNLSNSIFNSKKGSICSLTSEGLAFLIVSTVLLTILCSSISGTEIVSITGSGSSSITGSGSSSITGSGSISTTGSDLISVTIFGGPSSTKEVISSDIESTFFC